MAYEANFLKVGARLFGSTEETIVLTVKWRLIRTGDPDKIRAASLLLEHGYEGFVNVVNELGDSFLGIIE